jgi:hypothetical protein
MKADEDNFLGTGNRGYAKNTFAKENIVDGSRINLTEPLPISIGDKIGNSTV